MIVQAAEGSAPAREAFARQYLPVVTAYFRARWRGSRYVDAVDDATQEVFLDCFRDGGALERVVPRGGSFRAYLYGVARYVALRQETKGGRARERQAPDSGLLEGIPADHPSLGRVFDRAWAERVVGQARARHAEAAQGGGDAPRRRFELLRLRFEDGLPIRDIATKWGEDPARIHHDYADARAEFRRHLLAAVTTYLHAPTPEAAEEECGRLLECLRME